MNRVISIPKLVSVFTGRPIEILETRGSAIVSKVPDIVDPSSEECDDLNLVLVGSEVGELQCLLLKQIC